MYRSLSMLVPEDLADDTAALLIERGADGVEVEDQTVMLMPGKTRPPAGTARLIAYVSPEVLDPHLEEMLADFVGSAVEVESKPIPDQDWNEVWKSHFSPIEVSPRLWVCPSWRLGETPPGAKVLVLDPGMAFGTGTHATTSLCMHAIDAVLAKSPELDVLDVGTGSGILAIAAKLLGARRVVGTDNDPVAIRVAEENAALNQVELDLSTQTLHGVKGPFPLVVANIMAGTLIELAPLLVRQVAPGGTLLLSGILDFQADEVAAAYAAAGLTESDRQAQAEWVLLQFTRS
jgi:ribosomal protein L11 methyltransferase